MALGCYEQPGYVRRLRNEAVLPVLRSGFVGAVTNDLA